VSVAVFVLYLPTKFHTSSSNGSLIVIVRLEGKGSLRMATILFVYVLKTKWP